MLTVSHTPSLHLSPPLFPGDTELNENSERYATLLYFVLENTFRLQRPHDPVCPSLGSCSEGRQTNMTSAGSASH